MFNAVSNNLNSKTSSFIYFVSLCIKLFLLPFSHLLYFILSLIDQWSQQILFGCTGGEFIPVGAEIIPVRKQTKKDSFLPNTKQLSKVKTQSVKERRINSFKLHSLKLHYLANSSQINHNCITLCFVTSI